MKKLASILSLLLLLCCSSPQKEKSLRIAFSNYPTTVDPRKSGDFTSSTLICLIYEGLTRCLPGDEVELALAERVEVSEDQKVYTFFLRDAVWSDGEPITATDFEHSWKKILDPSFPSLCAYLLYPIKNAERYASGQQVEVGIQALDAKTLRIELERPTPYFVSLTAFPLLLPIPSHIEEQNPNWDQNPGAELVCSGPFAISEIKTHSSISLKRNDRFWNRENTALEGIRILIVPDESAALQMFEQNELDWLGAPLSPLPPDALPLLKNLQFTSMAASTFCTFNTETFPFSNRAFRKAFSYAIDREKIAYEITQLPATRCLPPPLSKGNSHKTFFPSDPERAKYYFSVALKELQIENLSPLILYYKPGQIDKRLAQALQRQWADVLGVSVQLVQLDAKTHAKKLQRGDYQLSLASWIAQIPDPINLFERFRDPQNPKNYPRWHNGEYDSFLQAAFEEPDLEKRLRFLEKAEEIFSEEMPIAPIYHWRSPCLAHPRVKNLTFNAGGAALFERCSLEDD